MKPDPQKPCAPEAPGAIANPALGRLLQEMLALAKLMPVARPTAERRVPNEDLFDNMPV
ncbi:MAG: hypothetical protein Q7J57_17620 [Gemmobacter sp.]|nr:hypothetical protein [Gemmobacter sp.]